MASNKEKEKKEGIERKRERESDTYKVKANIF